MFLLLIVLSSLPILAVDMHSFHNIMVNSAALATAGITRDTPAPAGGVIERGPATGELTGVLKEFPAVWLIYRHAPPRLTTDEARRALQLAVTTCNEYGITSVQEASAVVDRQGRGVDEGRPRAQGALHRVRLGSG